MATNEFSSRLHDAVENYYQYNPDTLMPLLMLALATQGQLKITEKKTVLWVEEEQIIFMSIQ